MEETILEGFYSLNTEDYKERKIILTLPKEEFAEKHLEIIQFQKLSELRKILKNQWFKHSIFNQFL
jgi:hypothetical protein